MKSVEDEDDLFTGRVLPAGMVLSMRGDDVRFVFTKKCCPILIGVGRERLLDTIVRAEDNDRVCASSREEVSVSVWE